MFKHYLLGPETYFYSENSITDILFPWKGYHRVLRDPKPCSCSDSCTEVVKFQHSSSLNLQMNEIQTNTSKTVKSIICCFHHHPVSYPIVTIHAYMSVTFTYLLEPEKGRNTETLNAPTLELEAALFILITK